MKKPLRLALPKGRMSDESLEYLHARKLTSLQKFPDGRELIFRDPVNNLEFLLIRSKDVGQYVEQGAADIGVMGEDLLQEHEFDVLVPLTLPFGYCRLSVAYPAGGEGWLQKKTIRVATKYPRLASRYFFHRGYHVQIIELYGSIEIAPLTGLSDIIVDLVSTGLTLKANNLIEEAVILESTARLIVNRSSAVFRRQEIDFFIDALK